MMAGALTLALAYVNKQTLAYADSNGGGGGSGRGGGGGIVEIKDETANLPGLQSRILIISVSSDLAFQYIPVMNCIFAAQRRVGFILLFTASHAHSLACDSACSH